MQTLDKPQGKKSYKHLSQSDRDRIQSLLDQGVDEAEIGRIIGRNKSTVGREIKRNSCGKDERTAKDKHGKYEATNAGHKAYVNRLYAKYQGKKIQDNPELQSYLIAGLKKHWSPDEISGVMKRESQPFYASKTAIYEWLYSAWGQAYCPYLPSKQHAPKKHIASTNRVMIPDRVSIWERPLAATNRTEYGHHEGDTMVSGKKTRSLAAIAVDVDRKSRFISARTLMNLKPGSFNTAMLGIQSMLTGITSRTYDNGIENREHGKLGIDSYFCDPYSSWQKGAVENVNRMLRRYFPKGMDLSLVSERELQRVVRIINNKPRKILGYKSALQVMREEGLLRQNGLSISNVKVALRG